MDKFKLTEIQSFLKAIRLQQGDMSLQRLSTLLEVAIHEEIDQSSLVKSGNLSRGAASKNIASWCTLNAQKRKGPGYLKSELDPMNLKIRNIKITNAGKQAIESAMAGCKNDVRRQTTLTA